MYQFFVDDCQIGKEYVTITGSDVNHIKNVLRMRPGEKIRVSSSSRDMFCEIAELTDDFVQADILDEEWKQNRGVEIASVGIASISYDEESTKLINMRNQGAMLSDPTIREGYVQGSVARGMEAAGSNAAGSVSVLWAWDEYAGWIRCNGGSF